MIYSYIKANPKVAEYLGISGERYHFSDGNVMLWKFDLMPLGGNNELTLRRIGAVGMTSTQARAEQRGETVTPLPVAEDEQFRMETDVVETETGTQQEEVNVSESESAGEGEDNG